MNNFSNNKLPFPLLLIFGSGTILYLLFVIISPLLLPVRIGKYYWTEWSTIIDTSNAYSIEIPNSWEMSHQFIDRTLSSESQDSVSQITWVPPDKEERTEVSLSIIKLTADKNIPLEYLLPKEGEMLSFAVRKEEKIYIIQGSTNDAETLALYKGVFKHAFESFRFL